MCHPRHCSLSLLEACHLPFLILTAKPWFERAIQLSKHSYSTITCISDFASEDFACFKMAAPSSAPHFAQRFAFRIKHIQHEDKPTRPSENRDGYWCPPSSTDQFNVQHATPFTIWDPGTGDRSPSLRTASSQDLKDYRPFRTSSLFWCPDRQAYLHVPLDCTAITLVNTDHVWRRLTFRHCEIPDRSHIAILGYSLSRFSLPMRGPGHWFEQLLPLAYQPAAGGNRQCELAGDLSILVGLVAFSAAPAYVLHAVKASFRPDLLSTKFTPNQMQGSDSKSANSFFH